MNGKSFRPAFVVFHLTLGVVVFLQSVGAVLQSTSGHVVGAMSSHLTILAFVEALGALLFLFPKTARVGGGILLVVFAIAITVHGVHGELALLVYAAGIALIMVQGGSYKME